MDMRAGVAGRVRTGKLFLAHLVALEGGQIGVGRAADPDGAVGQARQHGQAVAESALFLGDDDGRIEPAGWCP
jgi:hypothetical protein